MSSPGAVCPFQHDPGSAGDAVCPHSDPRHLKLEPPLTLNNDGDTFEQAHWPGLADIFPTHEGLWERHIAPLSFRAKERENIYIRPSQEQVLLALANHAYAVFFHLAQAQAWRTRFTDDTSRSEHGSAEILYAFFNHAISTLDVVVKFADTVNRVLGRYYGQDSAVFSIFKDETYHEPLEITRPWSSANDHIVFGRLRAGLKYSRRYLVHHPPFYAQGRWIPNNPEHLRGLDLIAAMVGGDRGMDECYEDGVEVLTSLMERLAASLESIWRTSAFNLDRLQTASPEYRCHQSWVRPADKDIRLATILAKKTALDARLRERQQLR